MILKILAEVFSFLNSAAIYVFINKIDVNKELRKEVIRAHPHVDVDLKGDIPLLSGGKK